MARRIDLTASMIRAYKSCPKLYEFQYIHMLKPEKTPTALETGSNYHAQLERLLTGQSIDDTGLPGIMAEAFDRFIPWRDWKIAKVEEEFDWAITPFLHMRGKIDAVCSDGIPVEHKTAGQSIGTETASGLKYVNHLAWDDQVSYYLLALSLQRDEPVTTVRYTVCQKPSIRLKQGETEEAYLDRCREWYDDTKVRFFEVHRSEEELDRTETEVRGLASEIRRRKVFYRNPSHCSLMGCSYASICLDYDPEIITGFVRKERESEELATCRF
ncbi:MAG: PD-(D/E)XK nuclease family protein [Dethiosulfovibrio sp.]|nr:PD-(D/E)XK nuclease family protein [Dethiosulfovibrio sp.]